jgi:hypothetical protein
MGALALVLLAVVALRVQKLPEEAPTSPQPDHPAPAAVARPPEPVPAAVTPLPAAPTPTVPEPAPSPPEPAPPRVATPRTSASPGPVAKRAKPVRALAQPAAAAGLATGEAQFHCNPADTVCRVSVDGRDLGETDLTETLPVGEHTAVFTSEQHLQRTRRFRVEPGASPVKVIAEY